jgi:hypothetical protein
MEQLASLFGISDSAVHRVIDRLAPHLAELLGPPPSDRRDLWIVDGTPIPVHDKKRTAQSKNYRRSVTTQIVCRARDRRIAAVSPAWPGHRHDTVVFRETLGGLLRRSGVGNPGVDPASGEPTRRGGPAPSSHQGPFTCAMGVGFEPTVARATTVIKTIPDRRLLTAA